MFKPQLGFNRAVFDDLKRRSLRGRKDFQLVDEDFHLAGGDVGVYRRADTHGAVRTEHILGAYTERKVEHLFVGGLVKGELHDAGAVAQVDEYQAAEVALALYPAHDADAVSDVAFAELSAVFCSFVLFGEQL